MWGAASQRGRAALAIQAARTRHPGFELVSTGVRHGIAPWLHSFLLAKLRRKDVENRVPACGRPGHDEKSRFSLTRVRRPRYQAPSAPAGRPMQV